MKKIFTIILSVLLIIGTIPLCASAQDSGVTTFFVSADGNSDGSSESRPMSLSSLNSRVLTGNTRVLFKCGDTFYGNVAPATISTSADSIIELGTYGSGALPIFSGAKIIKSNWTAAGNGFYKYNLTDTTGFEGLKTTTTNIGFIENNAGNKIGLRCLNATSCTNEYDFYCDEQFIYIKTEKDPYAVLGELKLACGISVFSISSNMDIHDLHIRDAGYGIVWKTKTQAASQNVKIYNCVFDNLGGHYIGGLNSGTKGGNAIEFYSYATDCIIENNIIRNCYDVGFTCQGKGTWSNVTVNNNIFAYNTQAIEIWCGDMYTGALGVDGLKFEDNICIGQGQGWGYEARPNKRVAADVLTYKYEADNWNMTVRNNLFFHSNSNASVYYSSLYSKNTMISDVTPNGNSIYYTDSSDALFKDDINDITFEQWNALGCDTESEFNVISNFFRTKKLEQLAMYSYDFNEILNEASNADLSHNSVALVRDASIVPGRASYAQIPQEGNILSQNGEISITPHQIATDGLDWTATSFGYEGRVLSDAYIISGSAENLTNGDYGDHPSTEVYKISSDGNGTPTAKEIATRRLALKIDLGAYYNPSSVRVDTSNGGWATARRIFGYNVYGATVYDENTILNNENLLGTYLSDASDYYYNSPRSASLANAENIRYVVIVFNLLGSDPGVKDNTILTDLTGVPVVAATSYIYSDVNGSNKSYASSAGMTFLSEIEIIGMESDYVPEIPENILINNENIKISPIQIATNGLDWTKSSFSYEGMEITDAYIVAGSVNDLVNGDGGTYPSGDVMSINSVKTGTLTAKEIATRRLGIKIDLGGYYNASSISVDTANATWATGRMLYSYNVYGSSIYNSDTILNDTNLIGSFIVNGEEGSGNYYWTEAPRMAEIQCEDIRYIVIVFNLMGTDPGVKDNSIMTDLTDVAVVPATSYIFRDVNGTNSGYSAYAGRPFLSEIEIIGLENKGYLNGFLPGDVTGDGNIDIRDVVKMKKYYVLEDEDIIGKNIDINEDGAKDVFDLVAIRRYLLIV